MLNLLRFAPDGRTLYRQYSSAFAEMVADPQYRKISPLRSRALSEAVLQPTQPWGRRRDAQSGRRAG